MCAFVGLTRLDSYMDTLGNSREVACRTNVKGSRLPLF